MSAPRLVPRILGVLGGLLLVVADFSTLLEISSGSRVLADKAGGEQHGYAFVVLGVAAILLAVAATRPAAARFVALLLLLVGLAAVLIILTVDAPDLGVRGAYENLTEVGRTRAGLGFFLESGGAVLVLAAGGLALLAPRDAVPATAHRHESSSRRRGDE